MKKTKKKKSHFVFDVIDKNMVRNLKKGSKYLSMLEKKWVAFDSKNSISVYDNIFDMILFNIFYDRIK